MRQPAPHNSIGTAEASRLANLPESFLPVEVACFPVRPSDHLLRVYHGDHASSLAIRNMFTSILDFVKTVLADSHFFASEL